MPCPPSEARVARARESPPAKNVTPWPFESPIDSGRWVTVRDPIPRNLLLPGSGVPSNCPGRRGSRLLQFVPVPGHLASRLGWISKFVRFPGAVTTERRHYLIG